ncbi:MAG: LysE family translocator [Rhizobiaceae bacterium]
MSEYDAIFLGIGAYLVATISPGPAVLAIMGVSARHGRVAGLQLASGVVCGSLFWGMCAAFGLATVMAQFADLFFILKIGGGLYLLWLAFKALRSAFSKQEAPQAIKMNRDRNYVLQGLAIHLTNPKAVLAWVAILAIGVQQDAPVWHAAVMFGSCAFLGICVFLGYALLFSTHRAQALYARARRIFEFLFGCVFGAAGLMLITDRS